MFSTTKASRKVQKCSELQTNTNSFPAKSVQISHTNRHISQWCASRGFLFAAVHECDNSHQIAASGTGNNHLLQTNDFRIFCIFLHVSGFESLVAKITNTHSVNFGAQGYSHRQFQLLNHQGPVAAFKGGGHVSIKNEQLFGRLVPHVWSRPCRVWHTPGSGTREWSLWVTIPNIQCVRSLDTIFNRVITIAINEFPTEHPLIWSLLGGVRGTKPLDGCWLSCELMVLMEWWIIYIYIYYTHSISERYEDVWGVSAAFQDTIYDILRKFKVVFWLQ